MYSRVVVVAGVARSGTSWLGIIMDSNPDVTYRFQPIFSYAFKNAINEESTRDEFGAFFKGIYLSQDDFLTQKDKRESGVYPTFRKNAHSGCLIWKEARHQYVFANMLRRCPDVKLIGIIRHPCAVINSWLRNPKEFPPGSEPRCEWRSGACKNEGKAENFFGYYKWKEVAHMYLDLAQQMPDRVRVVRYKDLVDETASTVRSLFQFAELEFTAQTEDYLSACHQTHKDSPYSVYRDKSVKDKWREQLDPVIADEIQQDLVGTRLEPFLA